MYPWYKDSAGQFCGGTTPMPMPMPVPAIKTENCYTDCMLALDYAPQSKKSAFVWPDQGHHGHHGHNVSALGGGAGANKCGGQGVGSSGGGGSGGAGSGVPGTGTGSGQPQGLVHWMSVMAEHMNNAAAATPHHHDPMHYMWNGVDQCAGSHIKDNEYGWSRQSMMKQGYESKMNNHNNSDHQKGMDDNPLSSAGSVATPSPHYNGGGSVQAPRSCSESSSSPPIGLTSASSSGGPNGHMLIVPHPVKITDAHHVVTQNTSGRKYQCKMCPSIFTSKSELQLHSQLHMREVKPYKCTQCSKTFANSSYLSQHTRIHLGIKPYRCEICQRKFTQLSHLQQHIRTHTGDKPYKCRHPGCTKAFSQLSNLQSHSRCHQTDKPYKCNSCYKCFSDEPSLLEHIPKHKESKHLKTHICQYCGKSYTQETYLTKHMQKHAERLEKRPPIIGIPRVALDNAHYWPKVSPDTANHLVEAINQHEACLQNGGMTQQQTDHMQKEMQNGGGENELLSNRLQAPVTTPQGTSPLHLYEPIITMSTPAIKPPSSSSSTSAFTPIQSMAGINHHHHMNHHHHHQIDRSPYLPYGNPLAFSSAAGKMTGGQFLGGGVPNSMDKGSANGGVGGGGGGSNAFPNQLISLHQIRNYAHQPAHSFTEHFMGLKDK